MGSKDQAQEAVFDAVAQVTAAVMKSNIHVSNKAESLRDLALAYRFAAGGSQPGGAVVEKR